MYASYRNATAAERRAQDRQPMQIPSVIFDSDMTPQSDLLPLDRYVTLNPIFNFITDAYANPTQAMKDPRIALGLFTFPYNDSVLHLYPDAPIPLPTFTLGTKQP